MPPVRNHCPPHSGYFPSPSARAPAVASVSMATSTAEPIRRRLVITLPPQLPRHVGRFGEADGAVRHLERAPVAEADLIRRPGAARRAAAQRGDPHPELVARLESSAGPALADEKARALALEGPGDGAA